MLKSQSQPSKSTGSTSSDSTLEDHKHDPRLVKENPQVWRVMVFENGNKVAVLVKNFLHYLSLQLFLWMGCHQLLTGVNLSIMKKMFTCLHGELPWGASLCVAFPQHGSVHNELFEIEFQPVGLELLFHCLLCLSSFILSVFLGIAMLKVGVRLMFVLFSSDMPILKISKF